jgi:hypothetical protein
MAIPCRDHRATSDLDMLSGAKNHPIFLISSMRVRSGFGTSIPQGYEGCLKAGPGAALQLSGI